MTDWTEFINSLPVIGWITIIFIVCIVSFLVYLIIKVLDSKNIRLKNIEISEQSKREMYQTEGKNVLDNQTTNAHHLLETVWIDIYEKSKAKFNITDPKDLFILEDISHLIEGQLNYQVKNDLTRNHILEKTTQELLDYSNAKAEGYYNAVFSMLYKYNQQLPGINLPAVMELISLESFQNIFNKIYFGAKKIAGGKNGN